MAAWVRKVMRDPGGRQKRVVLILRCRDQARFSRATVAKKARTPGRARHKL